MRRQKSPLLGGGWVEGDSDEMTKFWYPVLPGQPRSNVGWDFPAKRAEMLISKYVGEEQL